MLVTVQYFVFISYVYPTYAPQKTAPTMRTRWSRLLLNTILARIVSLRMCQTNHVSTSATGRIDTSAGSRREPKAGNACTRVGLKTEQRLLTHVQPTFNPMSAIEIILPCGCQTLL